MLFKYFFQDGPCTVARNEELEIYEMFGDLVGISDFSLPSCDSNGYYAPMQCNFQGCYCASKEGKLLEMLDSPDDKYCQSLAKY